MNCLITGATGGIGKSICESLKDVSRNLYLVATNDKKLIQLKNHIESSSQAKVTCFVCDFKSSKDLNELIKSIESLNIDVLINSAGIFDPKPIKDVDFNEFNDYINVNLKAPYFLMKSFQKGSNKSGIIVNIGSSSSYAGFADNSMYCLTKHAILGASRSLFEEFKKENIRVYCISPSGTKTNMGEKIQGQDYNTFLNPEEISNFIRYLIDNSGSNMIMNEVFLKRYYN